MNENYYEKVDVFGGTDSIKLSDAVNSWLNVAASRYAPITYENYRRYIYRFVGFFPRQTQLKDVKLEHLERFLASLSLKKSSANVPITVLKSFFRAMADWTGLLNPASRLKTFKAVHHKRFLAEDECSRLLANAKPREHALIQILSNTGLRITELLNATASDIHNDLITVSGKNKQRSVPLNDNAKTALAYLFKENMYLLKILKSRAACNNMLYRLAKRSGLDKGVSPHDFRRLFANRLRRHGVDIFIVSKLLGHSSLNTTMVYLGLDAMELQGITDFMCKPALQNG